MQDKHYRITHPCPLKWSHLSLSLSLSPCLVSPLSSNFPLFFPPLFLTPPLRLLLLPNLILFCYQFFSLFSFYLFIIFSFFVSHLKQWRCRRHSICRNTFSSIIFSFLSFFLKFFKKILFFFLLFVPFLSQSSWLTFIF